MGPIQSPGPVLAGFLPRPLTSVNSRFSPLDHWARTYVTAQLDRVPRKVESVFEGLSQSSLAFGHEAGWQHRYLMVCLHSLMPDWCFDTTYHNTTAPTTTLQPTPNTQSPSPTLLRKDEKQPPFEGRGSYTPRLHFMPRRCLRALRRRHRTFKRPTLLHQPIPHLSPLLKYVGQINVAFKTVQG